MAPNPKEEGINERMKRLIAMQHCPQCGLLPRDHDENACDMRYEEDIVCVTYALKPQPQQPLHYLDGDSGCIV